MERETASALKDYRGDNPPRGEPNRLGACQWCERPGGRRQKPDTAKM
jgi:hypothetical protein